MNRSTLSAATTALILLLVLACAGILQAAPELRYGGAVGAGMGYLTEASNKFDRLKFGGGISIECPLSQNTTIRTGLYWNPKGSGYGSFVPEVTKLVIRLNCVTLPMLLTHRVWLENRVPVNLMAGAEVAYLINARFVREDMSAGSYETDVISDALRWDFAPTLGIGVPISDTFELTLHHTWGLRTVWGWYKTRSFWITATLWLP